MARQFAAPAEGFQAADFMGACDAGQRGRFRPRLVEEDASGAVLQQDQLEQPGVAFEKRRFARSQIQIPHPDEVRAVSKLTGIGIDTLRAWERRHGAVTPIRDDRGRMYTDADVARLRLLRGAVEHGHTIGRLAALTDAELRRLAATAGASAVSESLPRDGHRSTPPRSPPRCRNTMPPPSTSRSAGSRRSCRRSNCSGTC